MSTRRLALLAVVLGSTFLLWTCGATSPSGPTPGGGPPPSTFATVLAAGDIGECGFGALETGKILDRLSGGTLLALGDLAYQNGSAANFRDCYDPAWGRQIDRTRPVPGNHEYETDPAASAYYDYFGELAGPRGLGYYAFTTGVWRIIALNSEIPHSAGTAQLQWLRNELQNNRTPCTLAYWHRPLFTSGPNLPQEDVRPYWTTLAEFDVDVVLNGHDHMYERFAPQDPDGRASATGIREFIAGTGGAHLYTPVTVRPNSEVRASVYGILVLTLNAGSYQWDFQSVNNTFRDSGFGSCH